MIKLEHLTEISLNRLSSDKGKTKDKIPPLKRLIGHLSNANYQEPPDDRWRHDDSDSDQDVFDDPDQVEDIQDDVQVNEAEQVQPQQEENQGHLTLKMKSLQT